MIGTIREEVKLAIHTCPIAKILRKNRHKTGCFLCITPELESALAGKFTMKQRLLLLIVLLFIGFIFSTWDGPSISITIVIPLEFVLYYDWIMDFPVSREDQQVKPQPDSPNNKKYQPVQSVHDFINAL